MQILHLCRPSITVNIENASKKFLNIGKVKLKPTMKGLMRVLIWTVKMSVTMVSGPWILMLWCTRKNKVGVIM